MSTQTYDPDRWNDDNDPEGPPAGLTDEERAELAHARVQPIRDTLEAAATRRQGR